MKIVVFCNKRDFFLTKICIASIRYYYPLVDIFIVKDYWNGNFDSRELEKFMKVKVLDLGIRNYGWSAAKMHFLLSHLFEGEKVLTLDSDIVFAGKFLEALYENAKGYDFAVNAEYYDNADTPFVRSHYYDIHYLNSIDARFKFPGYFFNGGQMLVTTNKVASGEVIDFFDLSQFPYWKKQDKMPFVDQSLLNYILPKKEQNGEIKILKTQFMIWSQGADAKELKIQHVLDGDQYRFIIHWAGALRIPYINKMTRPDILLFFQKYYYDHIPWGTIRRYQTLLSGVVDYYLRHFYRNTFKRWVKKIIAKR